MQDGTKISKGTSREKGNMGTKQKTTIAKVDWMDMIFDIFRNV
jgi:hypothetical protein